MMSEEEVKKRETHQDRVYKENKKQQEHLLEFHGRKILVTKNVFAFAHWESNLLAQTVLNEVRAEDKVLDMGTGSGVQAIMAASRSRDITAVDINPEAVECAKENVERNNLASKIKVFESDLFENVKGKFDLIIFDPPFRWTKPRDMLERATADEGYKTLTLFFEQVSNFLNENGRILMHFGTSADLDYFRYLAKKNNLKMKRVLKERNEDVGYEYFTFRLEKRIRL